MLLSTGDPLLVEHAVVPDVETEARASLLAQRRLILVTSTHHPTVRSGQNINVACAQSDDEGILHGVLVEVQPNSAHRGDRGSDSRPTFSANASSSAKSPSISSELA